MDRRTALSSLLTGVTALFTAPKVVAAAPSRAMGKSPVFAAPYGLPIPSEEHFRWMEEVRALVAQQRLPHGYEHLDFVDYDHNVGRITVGVRAPDGREIDIRHSCKSGAVPAVVADVMKNQIRYAVRGHQMLRGGFV